MTNVLTSVLDNPLSTLSVFIVFLFLIVAILTLIDEERE